MIAILIPGSVKKSTVRSEWGSSLFKTATHRFKRVLRGDFAGGGDEDGAGGGDEGGGDEGGGGGGDEGTNGDGIRKGGGETEVHTRQNGKEGGDGSNDWSPSDGGKYDIHLGLLARIEGILVDEFGEDSAREVMERFAESQ